MKRAYQLAIVWLNLVLILSLPAIVHASGPDEASGQADGRRVALSSNRIQCVAVDAGALGQVSTTVHLAWVGQIEEAFLVLAAAGSEGGHSIYVNGQFVGQAPVRPGGQPCRPESPTMTDTPLDIDLISIPVEVLSQGENTITLTNDANIDDDWTAANLYLEIHGVLSSPPVVQPESPAPALDSTIEIAGVITDSVMLTSSYDGIQQKMWYQIPDGYDGSSRPLLVGAHWYYATGEEMRDLLDDKANERGWLLAAPDMHGRYYTTHGYHALAWPGAQRDIIDTIEYMKTNYSVDSSRIYITGASMGGQITSVMAAKYPDIFASATEWKGFTDLTDWYGDLVARGDQSWRLTQIRNETGGTPAQVPFEYQRRSAMAMYPNIRLLPFKIWHCTLDALVPYYHGPDLANAINSLNPPLTVEVVAMTTVEQCPSAPLYHNYSPNLDDVLNFMAGFTLNSEPPLSVTIRTDESKPYYWLNFALSGGDHWSEVEAAYDKNNNTVTATISDTNQLTLGFNLGSTPIAGSAGLPQPGMGLPATTYLVNGGGNYKLENYTSAYLTTTLNSGTPFNLTISAIGIEVAANPQFISGGQAATATITATVKDQLNNPAPDGTTVQFASTEGTFPGGNTATTTAGQATVTLSLGPAADLAQVQASVNSVTGMTSVDMIYPGIAVSLQPSQATIYDGQMVTYAYHITNTGDIILTNISLVDDNGTPGDNGDDIAVCQVTSLAAKQTTTCNRNLTLAQSITNTVTVTGQDPLGKQVTNSDSATVVIVEGKHSYLPIVIKNN